MEAESSVRFAHIAPAGSVHSSGVGQVIPSGSGMIHHHSSMGMGALLAGFGMAPSAGIFLPGRPPAPASNAARNVWNGVAAMAGQHHRAGGGGSGEKAPQPQKGPWTLEEDETLKDKVREHGERKWAVIARFLPGRIGKQCRERWTNHLRPDIKKSLWTEEDDLGLIEAHKIYGNRWSMIARFLPGRSENSVKNHWNATRRSLKAKRRLKKKKNAQAAAHPGHFSVLEEYIRSVYPATADLAAAPPPAASPPSYNMGYGEVLSSPTAATPPAAAGGLFDPAVGMGMMYLNSSGSGSGSSSSASPPSSNMGMGMNGSNVPPMMLDLNNAYYGEVPLHHAMKPQVMMMDHHHHHHHLQQQQQQASAYANLMMMSYPFVDNFMWQQQSSSGVHAAAGANNNANYAGHHHQYYGGGRDDDVDVVQMASREFLMPSQDEATLDLARFM